MTAIPDAKSLALAQQEAAKATAELNAEAAAKAQLPTTKNSKIYRTHQVNASMQMIMPAGGKVVFIAGECITDKPLEQEFLDHEIATGNPYIRPDVEEVAPQISTAELIRQAEERAVANYKAQTEGKNAPASTSDNTGAGQTATTATAQVGVNEAPTAASAISARLAAAAVTAKEAAK